MIPAAVRSGLPAGTRVGRDRRPGPDLHRAHVRARSPSSARRLHSRVRRSVPRLPHPRPRHRSPRHRAGSRRGLRRRGGGDTPLQRRNPRHPLRHAARPVGIRHPDGGVRRRRQHRGREERAHAAPLGRARRPARPRASLCLLPRPLRGGVSGGPPRIRRGCRGTVAESVPAGRGAEAIRIAMACDLSRQLHRPVRVEEVG